MDWSDLRDELDRWRPTGRTATFWLRDDDAQAPSAALDRLLEITNRTPVAIAVIPRGAEPRLAQALSQSGARVVQHGWAHANHAPEGEKSSELGPHRPRRSVIDELAAGRDRLGTIFAGRISPVLVPPWNRIDPSVVEALPGIGFKGLSTFAPRAGAVPAAGIRQANCHVDLVDWRGGRCFRGVTRCLADLVGHLTARRLGRVDSHEPTGVLTHHLVHDDGCWGFLGDLVDRVSDHAAAVWLDVDAAVSC